MDHLVVDLLGRRQYGVVATAQLREAGLSTKAIRTARERGQLIPMHRGVYRVAGSPESKQQARMAAVLAGGPNALLSHRAALDLWALPNAPEAAVELVADRHLRTQNRPIIIHEANDLPACDRWIREGIPVTSIERTLIDVGRYFRERRVGAWVDHAVRDNHTTYERFQQRVLELARPGRNGIGTAKRVLADRGYGDGFGFERLMRGVIRDAGLPDPTREWRVRVAPNTYFVDFAYPEAGLGIECDSREWHTLPYQIDHDLRRQNDILATGILLLRYSYNAVRTEPGRVADEIRAQLLARTGWEPANPPTLPAR